VACRALLAHVMTTLRSPLLVVMALVHHASKAKMWFQLSNNGGRSSSTHPCCECDERADQPAHCEDQSGEVEHGYHPVDRG